MDTSISSAPETAAQQRTRILHAFERQRDTIDWALPSILQSSDKRYCIYGMELHGIARAYRDNGDLTSYDMAFAMADRILDYRSSRWVNPELAIRIFETIGVTGYNAFEPSLLSALPKSTPLQIGRGGSVVVYAKGNRTKLKSKLMADEVTYTKSVNETRIWWD